jgi:hypothetical protein
MSREQLIAVYLDWKNNFLTIGGFADHYGLFDDEANELIRIARKAAERPHPDA